MQNIFKSCLVRVLCFRPVNWCIRLIAPVIRRCLSPDKRSRIPIVGTNKIILADGVEFYLYSNGRDRIASMLFWNGPHDYDWHSIRVFEKLVHQSNCILDLGANIGLLGLVAAAANKNARIFAFEPVPSIFVNLTKNIAVNQFENLDAIESAVGDSVGIITLSVPDDFQTHPWTASAVAKYNGPTNEIVVACTSIDAFSLRHRLPRVDLIKSDTEGMESRVLMGSIETLKKDRPLILMEVWPGNFGSQIEEVIGNFDYQYFWITESGLNPMLHLVGDPESIYLNYLLVPREKLVDVKLWLGELAQMID